ncbi:hypothetical protein HQO38_18780 [Rhodococcus fascians]|nr:hypothetical protein [Rhodococcus fascians]MBY4140524.1 hypothetical protein [Rhodococcus fascians]MBY4219008.1 hypothetical protein [Rhodococcus fascians]MBY4221960.1 hypothetical protein [Rhodococcus fascians]MBY4233961.1 hypothetical protein [Rhodococcus fascians]
MKTSASGTRQSVGGTACKSCSHFDLSGNLRLDDPTVMVGASPGYNTWRVMGSLFLPFPMHLVAGSTSTNGASTVSSRVAESRSPQDTIVRVHEVMIQ